MIERYEIKTPADLALGIASFLAVAVALPIGLVWSINSQRETSDLVNKAIAISAGEDKEWSRKEQRAFLDDVGLENVELPANTEVYVDSSPGTHAKVYLKPRHAKDGSFLSRTQFRDVGSIPKGYLAGYIDRSEKK